MGSCPVLSKVVWNALMKRLLSVAIRSQINKNNHSRLWTIELVFFGTPLQSTHHREQGLRRTVYYQYDLVSSDMVSKTIDSLLSDWSKIVYLYSIVHEFAEQYKNGKVLYLSRWIGSVSLFVIIYHRKVQPAESRDCQVVQLQQFVVGLWTQQGSDGKHILVYRGYGI